MKLPEHIAIIMDGNGRWAKKRLLPKMLGHRNGAKALDKLMNEADKLGLKHMTVYAFSTENWKRAEDEITALMGLLREYIKDYISRSETSNIRINVIGDISKFPPDLVKGINELEEVSSSKTGMFLHIALNYGGRDDIVRAARKMFGDIGSPEEITEEMFSRYVDTAGIPDPELIIRTSGEMRLSNFLLWQSAYSEFYFTDKLWPDFTAEDLKDAVEYYNRRERRFGGRNEVR